MAIYGNDSGKIADYVGNKTKSQITNYKKYVRNKIDTSNTEDDYLRSLLKKPTSIDKAKLIKGLHIYGRDPQ